jgi:hypothetical protein
MSVGSAAGSPDGLTGSSGLANAAAASADVCLTTPSLGATGVTVADACGG